MLHRLDRTETRKYLSSRAAQGFNVIQTVLLAELDGLTEPNRNGDLPLLNQDPTQPNEAYFAHVDWALNLADSLGLYFGLLPTWGDKFSKMWGVGPEIFTPQNAKTYGQFLGRRYRGRPVIWILGGDRNPADAEDLAIIRAMATGLRDAVGNTQLITYHPQGGSSSVDFFANDDWIDFHMFQSGHGSYNDKANYDQPRNAHRLNPNKPVVNGEPAYEDHPVNWRTANGYYTDFDARQAAFWSVLAGGAGHTFGNHNIWQFYDPAAHPGISSARTPWPTALHFPAAAQIGHLRRALEENHYALLRNSWDYLANAPNSGGNEVLSLAGMTPQGFTLLAYTPYGHPLAVRKDKMPAGDWTVDWWDPRSGHYLPAAEPSSQDQQLIYDPPFDVQRGNDWLLRVRINP
ncbi:MAG: DUF4038 domain-containing protein [Lewinella sp.]|nr:DUF4038 domain-containing protein [Lewinella sp.]